MINLYKFVDSELKVLLYNPSGPIPDELIGITLLESNIDLLNNLQYWDYPIFHYQDFFAILMMQSGVIRDKILYEEGLFTFRLLRKEYFDIKLQQSFCSKRVRDMVVSKYSEIINMEYQLTIFENSEENSQEVLEN